MLLPANKGDRTLMSLPRRRVEHLMNPYLFVMGSDSLAQQNSLFLCTLQLRWGTIDYQTLDLPRVLYPLNLELLSVSIACPAMLELVVLHGGSQSGHSFEPCN
jgi:hypothetical protein